MDFKGQKNVFLTYIEKTFIAPYKDFINQF